MAKHSFDREFFLHSLKHNATFHAGRLIAKGDEYVNAAAVVMSVLKVLENHAQSVPLSGDMLRAVSDAVFEELGIIEDRTPMGGILYALPPRSPHRRARRVRRARG